MKYNQLGHTDIKVSELCLGTMTWGTQNNQEDVDQQLNYAVYKGINFIDTAEMYPTTPRTAENTGLTEKLLGNWLCERKDREKLIVATKITGEGNNDIRGGAHVTGAALREALEASLQRLKTDYVDLYQLHWPNRGSYHFRKYWNYDPRNQTGEGMEQEVADILGSVSDLIGEGKMRSFGLSNESAWGTMKWLEVSEKNALPRIVSMQNEYSLICRIYDLDMSEISVREHVGLMAYSPLGASGLTNKTLLGDPVEGSRLSMQPNLNGRFVKQSEIAIGLYGEVAKKHGLSLAQMSIAFCLTRPPMMSVIIGATKLEQLEENIAAKDLVLSDEVLEDIQAIYRDYPIPM